MVIGAGGVGKTILAEQACRDPRVTEAFPGGAWKVTLGERPDVERTARELHLVVTGREASVDVSALAQLGDAFAAGRALVLIDDVWPPDDSLRALTDALPACRSPADYVDFWSTNPLPLRCPPHAVHRCFRELVGVSPLRFVIAVRQFARSLYRSSHSFLRFTERALL